MRDLRSHAPVRRGLLAGFVLAAALTAFFAIRFLHGAADWTESVPKDPPIAGWMTPRYVVRAWDVPPEVVATALGLEGSGIGRRITLSELAADRGETPEALAARLEAAIAAFRSGQ